jgi:hypothetical protein
MHQLQPVIALIFQPSYLYPLVNVYKKLLKITMLVGKSTISTGQFSTAFCMFTRPGIIK